MIPAALDRWVSQEVVADILGLVHFIFLPRDPGDIVGTGGAWPFLSSKFTATRAFPSVERLTNSEHVPISLCRASKVCCQGAKRRYIA